MIEPDINERMSRFAPSQQQPDVDPVAAAIAARAMIPSSQPTMAEMPEVDSVARAIAERSRENLNAAVLGARTVNPDEAAKAIGLSRKIGIPPEVARADIGRAEQQAYLMDLRAKDFERTDPIMANFLSQKEFAEVAHDDISVLDSIRPIMQDWAMLYWTGATPNMRRGFERGQLVAERGDIGAKAMTGFAGPEDFDRAKQVELRLRELTGVGFLGATTEVIAQNLAQLKGIGTGAVAGAAVGSVVPVVGTVAGGALGATAGVMATTAQMEAGNLYLDLREQGVSDDTAIPVALAGGYINGVIEVVGMKVAAKPFQALAKRMIRESVAKAVAQPTVRAALATAGKSYFLQVGAQGTEESLQEIVIIAGEEVANAIDNVDTETSMAQAMDRVVDAFTQGAMGAAIMGGIGPGANLYVDLRRAATTQRQQEFFQRLSETSKESRLAQRSPDAYERFLEAQAKGSPAETIYVDARVAQQVFAQSGLTPQQLEEVLPGIRAQVEEAVTTGGDVMIQTARFGARLANTDLGNALLPHMRLDPDAMSVTEAQEFNARRQEQVREAEQILAQKQEADGAFVAEARTIEDTLTQQIVATGKMDEQAARTSAQFMRDFYVTQAAALGMTPQQVYERFPVRVEGAMPTAAAPLEQANRDIIAGVDAEIGSLMEAAKEASRAAGKTRSKDTQAAAFKAKQDWIAANPARYAEYQAAQRMEALENERVREAAASALADKIDESIATAAKTLTDAGFVLDYESPAPSKSKYYRKGSALIRVSDHEIPVTPERAAAREAGVQVPYRDFVFDGTQLDAEVLQELETIAKRTAPSVMEQAAVQPRLMAVHNLSADNLVFADRMGGLAVPSIGVITEERGGVEGFGEITLIGTREMADPYLSRVFESDAYSARFPQPEWPKVSVAKADKFVAQLRDVARRYDERGIIDVTFDQMVNNPNANKVAEAWLRSPAVMALFLGENGIDVAPIMRERKSNTGLDWPAIEALRPLYESVNQDQAYSDVEASPEFIALREAFGNAVRQKYAGVDLPEGWLERWATDFRGNMLSNLGRDLRQPETQRVDSSATRDAMEAALEPFKAEYKSWVDTKVRSQFGDPFLRVGRARKPYTLPNIVDVMTSAKVKGEEKGMTFGAGATRADVAKEFMDLEQMREAAKSAIVDPDEYGKVNKETNAQLEAYRNAAIEYTTLTDWRGQTDTWAALDGSMRALANYGKRKRKDAGTMRAALAREGFAVEKMPPALITQAIEAANALFTAPVPYFEAKPQRAVRLGEFAGAVIPSNVEQEVRDILDKNGLAYMTYIAGDEADRQRAVREMARSPEARGEVLFQVTAGPVRGGFDPKRLTTILTKTADLSTFLHESAHAFLTFYEQMSAMPDAPARIVSDLDELLRWFKIDGATPAERIANWNGLTLDQKRKYHETFAYNFEVYLFEGKAPSVEMQGLFERFSVWLKRVYRSIRDDLNAIYRREFGEDLPILTGEVRQVMDRMLATDDQIRRQAAINEMKPMFQTQEQSGMGDAEWAAYQAMQQEAIEAAVTDMNKASLRQMQWLGNARSRILKDIQRRHDRQRKDVAAEVAAAVRVEPVYRAMTYLRTGRFIDADGAEVKVEGPHRLDIKRVKAIYETVPTAESLEPLRATGMPLPTVVQPDLAKLGTGSYGMMGVDGLDPDLVAETFGYSSGDELIRALVAARPIKEEVAARTDAEMLRRFGELNTPEAVEAEVQAALHNEARARFVAVELRWITKATEPARVMVDAAKQVARDLIAGKRIRDVRPSDFVAAEARAARDATRIGIPTNPVAIGQAAQTRAYNEAIAAGTDPAEAMVAAIEAGAEAARRAQERSDALKAQYGADQQQALIRAKRAQLYQNQLAAEALRVQEEVAKAVKYLRRVLRDENVKRMGAPAADQIAGLLERYEIAPVSLKRLDERRALTEWLAQQAELGLVPDIAPEIVNEARRVNYREVKVSEFRDLVDAIRQIEHIGKRERKAAQEKLHAEFDALKAEAIQSMKDVAAKRGRKARKELGDEDRKWAQLIAGYDAMQQTIGSIVYVLDGGQRDGPLARMLLFTANDAGNQETTDRAEATLAISKILDPIYRKGQFGGRKLYFPQIDDSLSLEQRMVIALNYGNQSNIDRLLNGEKWTDEQVQPILESLTEEQLNAVQAIWNYLESFKPRVAAQERNLLGREPNWIEPRPFTVRSADGKVVNMAGGYYPAKYNPRRSSMSREMDESVEADRQMREAITAATTTRSYTKNRLDKPPEGGVLSRQMGGLYAGVNEVIHDLAWRTWAMDANRLLRDKEFQTVINSIYGRETYAALKNWVDATVRGERGNYDVIENIAIGVRRNVSVSAMGLKFITAAIQVTGLIPATVRTGITPMVRAVAYFAANPRESSRIAREKSSFMRNRGRTRYRDLNEIANIVRGESRARRAYLANAYALIGLQQGMVDMSVWWAAYSKAIKEGKAEEMAVSIADQTVIDTQGSGMLKDLSQAMRGGQKQSAYAKLFTSFYQFSNTQYALLSAQLRTAPSMGKAAADAFTILVVGAFIEEMLRTLLKPSPDDEEPEDLAKALIANQIDFVIGLPFGGGELRGIGDMIVGEQAMQYRGPSGLRMVGEVRTFAGQTLQGEFDRAWTRSAINMSGLIWGIPSAQINDTIDGINAAVEGEVEGAEAALAPITGVRR